MARTYGLHLIRRSLGGMAATLGLVLVVFLAERLTTLVEMLIQRHAPLSDLPLVLALTAPEIFITAMPLALLIGVYRALIEARDGGEIVVMAGAGVGPWRLLSPLLGFGALALVVVIVVAGWVDPLARAARDRLYLDAARRMVLESVGNGLPRDEIRTVDGHTVVSPSWASGGARRLLVFLPRDDGVERVVAAADYHLTEVDRLRRYHLILDDVTVADLPLRPPPGAADGRIVPSGSGWRLGTLSRDVDLEAMLREPVLADQPQYGTLVSLMRRALATATSDPSWGLRAAEIVTRAWLTIAAVLMAAIGMSFAEGRRRFVALPVAGAAMVVIDLGLVRMVRSFDVASMAEGFVHGFVAVVVLLVLLGVALVRRYPRVVAPAGGRA